MVSARTSLLLNAGLAAHAGGRLDEALDLLQEAARGAVDEGDDPGTALVFTNAGTVLLDAGAHEPAGRMLAVALSFHRDSGDRVGEQRCLVGLCAASSSLYQHDDALRYGREAVQLADRLADEAGAAAAYTQLGHAARRVGHTQEAMRCYRSATGLYRRIGPVAQLAASLESAGGLEYCCGRLTGARSDLEEALRLHRQVGDVAGQVGSLNALSWVLRDLGRPEEALDRLREAVRLADDSGRRSLVGATAHHLSGVLLSVGRVADAVEQSRAADRIARESGSPWDAGAAANGLARALLAAGDGGSAAAQARRAVEVAGRIAVPAALGAARLNLAIIELRNGDLAAAGQATLGAIEASATADDPYTETVGWAVAGRIAGSAGDPEEARKLLEVAVDRFQRLGSDLGAAVALADLADACYDLAAAGVRPGGAEEAVQAFERAMDLADAVRGRLLDEDIRATFFSTVADIPLRYAAVLVSLGRPAEALLVVERGRARVLADRMLELRSRQGRPDPGQAAGVARQAELRSAQLVVERELEAALRAVPIDEAAVDAIRDRRRSSLLDLQAAGAELRARLPRLGDLLTARVPQLDELRRDVIGHAVLLEYVLGEPQSLLLAATADTVRAFVLPGRSEIEQMVTELRAAIITRAPSYPHGHELYRALIAPAAELLGDRDLVLVTDGALHDLPFAVLLSEPVDAGARSFAALPYLIRDRAVTVLPSATVACLAGRRPVDEPEPDRQLLAFGAPVHPGETPLPHAEREVWGVAGLIETGPAATAGRESFDGARVSIRTGAAVTKTELERHVPVAGGLVCRFLHLATHGVFDIANPEFSGLLLSPDPERPSADPAWRAYEIVETPLLCDLVVLSACETGLGRTVGGEGVLGLGRSFLAAGASAVVVSLWRVNDSSTAKLMVLLYRHLLGPRRPSPAGALRLAQLAMIDGGRAHPFHWAGFDVVGPPARG